MNLYDKLLEVCRLFKIEDEFVGYETIQMGNVNKTYKVNFLLPGGVPKSFLVQNVNTYAFRHPVQLMENLYRLHQNRPPYRPHTIMPPDARLHDQAHQDNS